MAKTHPHEQRCDICDKDARNPGRALESVQPTIKLLAIGLLCAGLSQLGEYSG